MGHFENKVLTSFSESENEVRPAVIVCSLESDLFKKFSRLDVQAAEYP